jgi:hypothetical protein
VVDSERSSHIVWVVSTERQGHDAGSEVTEIPVIFTFGQPRQPPVETTQTLYDTFRRSRGRRVVSAAAKPVRPLVILHVVPAYPPAIAPTISNGSSPAATASGSGESGGSWERSSSQAKNLTNGRRFRVT